MIDVPDGADVYLILTMSTRNSTLVSVVIPCYNQGHYLSEAIESVLAQTHTDFEVIVIDDGSLDNTSAIAARYADVRYIHQENQGLSAARNAGLRVSQGEFLVFLDSDDRLLPNALELGLKCLKGHPECMFVFGGFRFIGPEGSALSGLQQPRLSENPYLTLLRGNQIGVPASVLYRRAVFEYVGNFDTSLRSCEDYDLYLRIARSFSIVCYEGMVAEYRRHSTSMSGDYARMLDSILGVLRSQKKHVKGNAQLEEAYKTGVRHYRDYYGDQLVTEVRARVRTNHDWRRALRGMAVLLRYHPRGFARHGYRKLSLVIHKSLERIRGLWTRNSTSQ